MIIYKEKFFIDDVRRRIINDPLHPNADRLVWRSCLSSDFVPLMLNNFSSRVYVMNFNRWILQPVCLFEITLQFQHCNNDTVIFLFSWLIIVTVVTNLFTFLQHVSFFFFFFFFTFWFQFDVQSNHTTRPLHSSQYQP